jgi:hypothetical protein
MFNLRLPMYIEAMASHEPEQPDLWSAENKPEKRAQAQQRRLLPHDLDVALKYLTDGELAALAKAVAHEQARRAPKSPVPQKPAAQKPNALTVEGLTQSQISLIRSSVKAGVKPATLSRQFGITRAQITAALKSAR